MVQIKSKLFQHLKDSKINITFYYKKCNYRNKIFLKRIYCLNKKYMTLNNKLSNLLNGLMSKYLDKIKILMNKYWIKNIKINLL